MLAESPVMTRDAIWAFKEKARGLKLRLKNSDSGGLSRVTAIRLVGGKDFGEEKEMYTVDLPRFLSTYRFCINHQNAIIKNKVKKP